MKVEHQIIALCAVFVIIPVAFLAFTSWSVAQCTAAGGHMVVMPYYFACSVNDFPTNYLWLQSDMQWMLPLVIMPIIILALLRHRGYLTRSAPQEQVS